MILDVGVFAATVLLMVTVGTELQIRQFAELVHLRKRVLFSVLFFPLVVLPVFGYFLTRMLALPAHLAAGILLLAACPVGDIANFYVLLARGNLALTVTMNTLTCLLAALTMGAVFWVYEHCLPTPFEFAVPPETLVIRMTLMAALPVLAGISLRRFAPKFVERRANTLRNISFAGIGFVLIYIFVTQRERVAAEWLQSSIVSAIFMCLAMLSGFLFAGVLRLNARDGFTTGVLFAVRNVGLALAIAVTLLGHVEYAVFGAVYFLTEVPVLLAAVAIYRQLARKFSGMTSNVQTVESSL